MTLEMFDYDSWVKKRIDRYFRDKKEEKKLIEDKIWKTVHDNNLRDILLYLLEKR